MLTLGSVILDLLASFCRTGYSIDEEISIAFGLSKISTWLLTWTYGSGKDY